MKEASEWHPHENNIRFFFKLYKGLCCVSFSFNKLVQISPELSVFISFLELAPSNFWVDEPQEISSDDMALKPISQLLVLLIFFKKSC